MKTLEEKREHNRQAIKKYYSTPKGKLNRYLRRDAYYKRTQHLSAGKRVFWKDSEVELLLRFDGKDEELAYMLCRSVASIQAKRRRLGKLKLINM